MMVLLLFRAPPTRTPASSRLVVAVVVPRDSWGAGVESACEKVCVRPCWRGLGWKVEAAGKLRRGAEAWGCLSSDPTRLLRPCLVRFQNGSRRRWWCAVSRHYCTELLATPIARPRCREMLSLCGCRSVCEASRRREHNVSFATASIAACAFVRVTRVPCWMGPGGDFPRRRHPTTQPADPVTTVRIKQPRLLIN